MKRSLKPLAIASVITLVFAPAIAKERRAAAPRFGADSFRDVFFQDVASSLSSPRPSVVEMRGIQSQAKQPSATGSDNGGGSGGGGEWAKLATPESIEDEIKLQKQLFDNDVAQPGEFKSGGYVKARLELSIMATLFGVIVLYEDDIRWKKDAEAARNLLARTAGNCNSGSIQVFNECKARKQDLEDLLGGGGISSPPAADESDWSLIADRSLMMEYLDILAKQKLPGLTNNDSGIKDSPDDVRRLGDMVAVIGHVLTQEGMDDAADGEYVKLSRQMRDAAVLVREAVERGDSDGARKAVAAINQACDACHEQYR